MMDVHQEEDSFGSKDRMDGQRGHDQTPLRTVKRQTLEWVNVYGAKDGGP